MTALDPTATFGAGRPLPSFKDEAAIVLRSVGPLLRAHACRSANGDQFPKADTNVERFLPARKAPEQTPAHLSQAGYAITARFECDVPRCLKTKLRGPGPASFVALEDGLQNAF